MSKDDSKKKEVVLVPGFKGFDKNLACRGKQYSVGETYEASEAILCERGLHFCEHPLDCFRYYPPAESRYCAVTAEDPVDKRDDDSKRVTKKLYIGAELSLSGLVDAAIRFVFVRAVWDDSKKATGDWGAALATGDWGAASATGDWGAALATGNRGAASATGYQGAASATGDWGAASATGNRGAASATGAESVAMACGYQGRAMASLGSWIVLAERDDEGHILTIKSARVDGDTIKDNTFYILRDGLFVEWQEDDA